MIKRYDVVVIGGGAAGLFCAIEAGKRGRRALVIERNVQLARKIIISGGGRCNFTNVYTSPENFISTNPHFAKSAFARYTPTDFISLVKKHRINFYEKKLGQLFCRETSRQIVDMLVKESAAAGVEILTGCSVTSIDRSGRFRLATTAGDLECENLVIATGGLSFSKVGATDFGYSVARQFGLKIVETRPSLVPLVMKDGASSAKLAGISVDAVVSTRKRSFRENILFTHRGLSGPAILQISNYWEKGEPVLIDLLPGVDARQLLDRNNQSRQTVGNFLGRFLPDRLVASFLPERLSATHLDKLDERAKDAIGARLKSWEVIFVGTEGYHRAEVTLGGVATDELSSQTMGSRKVDGLYFIGEVVDVTGWLGGYNFQWAWASGYAAGQSV